MTNREHGWALLQGKVYGRLVACARLEIGLRPLSNDLTRAIGTGVERRIACETARPISNRPQVFNLPYKTVHSLANLPYNAPQ